MQIVAVTDPLQVGFRRQAMIGIRIEGDTERGRRRALGDARGLLRRHHRGQLRPAGRGGLRGRRPAAGPAQPPHPDASRASAPPRRSSISNSTNRTTTGVPDDHRAHARLRALLGPAHAHRRAVLRGRPRPPVDALHPPLDLRGPRRGRRRAHRPDHHPRRGRLRLGRPRQEVPRRARRAVRRPGRPRPRGAGRGRRPAGPRAGVLPALVLRPPQGDRAGRAARVVRPRRPQPRLLHHRRRRGRRERLEAGQAVLQAGRQAHQAQGDQPRGGLPRHPAGRPVDHRHPRGQGDVRAAGARRVQGAQHQPVPRPRAPARGPQGLRAVGRRADRRGDRVRGPGHRGRGLPRAGAELRRLLPAAARLLPAGPRDLRRVRRAAGLRRGHLLVRPDRGHVRLQRLRLRPGHHHLRQGHDLRLLPDRRDDRQRPAVRAVHARARRTSRTATPSAATRSRRRSPWPTSTSSSARA